MVAIKGSTPSDRTVCKVMQRSLRIRRSPIHNSPPRDPLRDHRRGALDHVLTGEVSCKDRINRNGGRRRKTTIVALARKLLVALWKYVTAGVVIEGAMIRAA